MIKKVRQKMNYWGAILVSLLALYNLNGQEISGQLTNVNKNPMSYVNIGVVGLNKGTISNIDGFYTINLSGIADDETLKFSMVGYENVEFDVGEVRTAQIEALNITLKKKTYDLQEVVIKPNIKPINLGAKRRGRMAFVWSEAKTGHEIGTLIKNENPIILNKLHFHVKRNYCDSILYRVKIYNGTNEIPQNLINTKDIRFTSRLKKGWESVDLSSYGLKVNSDFIITLEILESWTSGAFRTTHLSISNKKQLSFIKPSSMANWTVLGNEVSFKVEVIEL